MTRFREKPSLPTDDNSRNHQQFKFTAALFRERRQFVSHCLDVASTRQAGMPAPLGAGRFAGVGSRGSDTGASVLSACSVSSVDSVPSVPSEFSEEFCCPRNLRERESGRRAFVKLRGKGGGKKKVFLQNEPIMSFRINKRIGFVLGLIGFVWLKKPLESQPRPLMGGRQGSMGEGKGAQAYRPVLSTGQARMSALPACRYLMPWRYGP